MLREDEVLTIKQVADEMHVSDRTVRRWINQDGLEVLRLSHKIVRIPRGNLTDFLHRKGTV